MENVLFFETAEKGICAHTAEEVYQVRYKLYELEKMLPGIFHASVKIHHIEYGEDLFAGKKIAHALRGTVPEQP